MQRYSLFLSVLSFLFCISCHSENASSNTTTNTKILLSKQAPLSAILHLKDSIFESSLDAYVDVTILNRGEKAIVLKAAELQQAILALEVFDLDNKLVPSIPPSVPLSEENSAYITIKPMEAFITTYDLHIFDPLLAKGRYTIKMKNMPSNQVSFEINTVTND